MLNSIVYINKVIPFDSTDELESTIKWIKPHIMVIGSDWKDGKVIGKKWAEKLIFFDRVGSYSSTKIIGDKKLKFQNQNLISVLDVGIELN